MKQLASQTTLIIICPFVLHQRMDNTRSAHKHPTILALLDIRKAFDSVWHNSLRFKIIACHWCHEGYPTIMKWLSQFLDGCTAQIRLRQLLSSPIQLNGGVSQGSAICPLLYILFAKEPLLNSLAYPTAMICPTGSPLEITGKPYLYYNWF